MVGDGADAGVSAYQLERKQVNWKSSRSTGKAVDQLESQ